MAALASTAVTLVSEWTEGGTNGRLLACRKLELVLTAQGTVANAIPASVLGFTKILDASIGIGNGDDVLYCAAPSYDGSQLLLKAAGTNAPADYTDTIRIVVKGD